MVYFVAKVVPFVAKGGPVLMAKGGILLVAEIGILYLTIYTTPFIGHKPKYTGVIQTTGG